MQKTNEYTKKRRAPMNDGSMTLELWDGERWVPLVEAAFMCPDDWDASGIPDVTAEEPFLGDPLDAAEIGAWLVKKTSD